jgi:hypothetical protein
MLRGRPLPAWSLVNWGYILFWTTLEWTYSTHAVATSRLKLPACLCRLWSSNQPRPWWSSDQPRSTHGSVRCMQSNNLMLSVVSMHASFLLYLYYLYVLLIRTVRFSACRSLIWGAAALPLLQGRVAAPCPRGTYCHVSSLAAPPRGERQRWNAAPLRGERPKVLAIK